MDRHGAQSCWRIGLPGERPRFGKRGVVGPSAEGLALIERSVRAHVENQREVVSRLDLVRLPVFHSARRFRCFSMAATTSAEKGRCDFS